MDSHPLSFHRITRSISNRIPHPQHDHGQALVLVPALVILIGLALRVLMLGIYVRLHPDEALFAAQARLINHQGDWLLRGTDLDKPPLTFYVTALSFRTLGTTEFAARVPNVFFSAMSLALLYRLAWTLYGDRSTATLAALLCALSPYDLAFAATAFTDIQATFWTLSAAVGAVSDRWRLAGVAAVFVAATKPNALLFLPLILALGITHTAQTQWHLRDISRRMWALTWPLLSGVGILVLWDMGRAPRSFIELGYTRNNPGRLIRAAEVWPRLKAWGHWLNFMTGVPALNGLLLVAIPLRIAYDSLCNRSRAAATDWLIAGFGIAFLAWHWLIAFNTYDRYLHTLVPFVLLLTARTLVWLARSIDPIVHKPRLETLGIVIAVALVMLPATLNVLQGKAAIGGDQGQHSGIIPLAGYLNTVLSDETVYDHWLGWELAFYLGESPTVTLLHAPLPEAVAADMLNTRATRRYLVTPDPPTAALWIRVLRQAGITVTTIYHDITHGFVIYRLESPD